MEAPFRVFGLVRGASGSYRRLPDGLAERVNGEVPALALHTAGGRIRFCTDSGAIAVLVKPLQGGMSPHMPLTGATGCDIYVGGVYSYTCKPSDADGGAYDGVVEKGPGVSLIEINLPLYNGIAALWIGLEDTARITPPTPYRMDDPVLFYGSSITQGGCASRPGNAYPAFLGRWLNLDHVNLGFSGCGRGEPVMAEYIASLNLSAFVMDYDHNAPTAEHLMATHERFFKIVRKAHPRLPVLALSKPDVERDPEFYAARREIIRRTCDRAAAAGDDRVWFIDGEALFGTENRDACTVDGSHPNDLGFLRMAEAIRPVLRRALGV